MSLSRSTRSSRIVLRSLLFLLLFAIILTNLHSKSSPFLLEYMSFGTSMIASVVRKILLCLDWTFDRSGMNLTTRGSRALALVRDLSIASPPRGVVFAR